MRSLLTVAVFFALTASARAETLTQLYFDTAGNPVVSAFVPAGDPSTFVQWRSCSPDGSPCEPVSDSAYERRDSRYGRAVLGETAAGTSFEAVYDTKTVRTPAWTGRMAVTVPRLVGDVTVGGSVTFVPPSWSGGWTPQTSWGPFIRYREIIACATATGGECWMVDFTNGARPGELDQAVLIEARWAGWYLFAAEYRAAADATALGFEEPPYALGKRAMGERAGPGTGAVSAPVGPVCCAADPAPAPAPVTTPGATSKPPTATIRKRAVRRNGRLVIGRVTCAQRCTVRLKVTGRFHPVIRTFSVTGTRTLEVPVRRGRLNVRVIINGKLVASTRTRAR